MRIGVVSNDRVQFSAVQCDTLRAVLGYTVCCGIESAMCCTVCQMTCAVCCVLRIQINTTHLD